LKTGIPAEPILIGREQELQELETYLNSAIDGKGKTVFISGEAASGKTKRIWQIGIKIQLRGAAEHKFILLLE
jgi:Cdc6-like AAA superfamily ATPase